MGDYQDYTNVFLTAPTGAGKSVFYQVSGIYLAQVHKAVTIVVSPLLLCAGSAHPAGSPRQCIAPPS